MSSPLIRLSQILKNRPKKPLNDLTLPFDPQPSAVLVPLFVENGDVSVLLTKRTEQVAHHKGQICFPGGVCDKNDNSLWLTAVREAREEIGIEPDVITEVGKLDVVVTPTGFVIHPFVATINPPGTFRPNPEEIEEIFFVPVSHLADARNLTFVSRTWFGRTYQDPVFTFRGREIWGATGRILVDLLEVWKSAMMD